MDQYRTVKTQGFFQRIINSFVGVLVGLLLFVASFVVLWKNEGNLSREKAALKELAANTMEGSIDEATPASEGKPVHLVGEILSGEQIGDPGYLVPGDYLKLRRNAEMFQWVESERSETREKLGGGSETVTTYTYEQKWRAGRIDSASFKKPEGHQNPEPTLYDADFAVSESTFGAWNGGDVLDHIWPDQDVELNEDMLDPELSGGEISGNYLYFRVNPDRQSNAIGDERLSWTALYPGTFSVIARHETGNRLAAIVASNGKEKFLVESGTRSMAEMIETERSAQSMFAWIFRGVGFLLMWIGLGLTLGPVATLLSVIPAAGSLGRMAIGMVTFVTALGLTIVTIIIGWVAHSPVVLAIAIAAGLGGVLTWMKKKQAATTPAPVKLEI